jgi:outer membrane PBP1 activator LpoA protein
MRRHALLFLLLVSCTLSGCDDTTNEKILAELKEINHRQNHQYRMQLWWRSYDDEIQAKSSFKEKRDILAWQEKERLIDLLKEKVHLLGNLNELKELNKKDFTGTLSIQLRAYVLDRTASSSFSSTLFKLFLRMLTSSKHDSDIEIFNLINDRISAYKLSIMELESYPNYSSMALEETVKNQYNIGLLPKSINKFISEEINRLEREIELAEKDLK